jgi:hypothetical protein
MALFAFGGVMWPMNAETAPRDDKRADVEPTAEETAVDGRVMDDPHDMEDRTPDEAGYGYGV